MQHIIRKAIHKALADLQRPEHILHGLSLPEVQLEKCRQAEHGDFACNIALMLAKAAQLPPREIAQQILALLPASEAIASVNIAGPGFINFKLAASTLQAVITNLLESQTYLPQSKHPQRIHMEFVSANPTGPLHVGHGRSAAYGACVANLLRAVGHEVHCEYYVNDAGRQIRILGLSTWLRYLSLACPSANIAFPAGAYQGDYIIQAAQAIYERQQERFAIGPEAIDNLFTNHAELQDDKDRYLDALIKSAIEILQAKDFQWICDYILEDILLDIKQDLEAFGVTYQNWFRESSLVEKGALKASITALDKENYVYQKDGATWFRATELGDEKDRVLIRANDQPTYFASDVAYHLYKYQQNYDHMIDIFGADHHGYIARIKAFLKGLKRNPGQLSILLVQFAILYRGKQKVSMSTRSGEFVSLRTLREEVGNDAARFFYIMRKPEQHLDFDLELAKSQSNENPVYYIQYAHARICQVLHQAEQKNIQADQATGLAALNLLSSQHETLLIAQLNRLADTVQKAATQYAPHMLAHYLQDLAAAFHSYYNAETFLSENATLCQARLCLIKATRVAIACGLKLLGVSAPERM